MAFNLTVDQIITLAPDDGAAKSSRDLAKPAKWSKLGANDLLAWGECQGSGANPYQTCADLTEIACKCSCPSRKFPCKHGLGLLLLLAKEASAFTQQAPPSWADAWLKGRAEKAEKKAKKAEEPPKSVDKEAQAKRLAKRGANVESGLADLDRWIQDAARHGLAELQTKPYQFWETQAARLVDAQAPGIARMLRDCAGIASGGGDWQEQLLARLAKIHLLIEAYKRIADMPEDFAAELRSLVGFTVQQDEVMQQPPVADKWYVVGQSVQEEEKLKTQRTWLVGEKTRRPALVLSFIFGTGVFDTSLLPGTTVDADLVFYPGAPQIRALVKSRRGGAEPFLTFPAHPSVESVYQEWADNLAINPWLEVYPVSLANVRTVLVEGGRWEVQDESGNAIGLDVGRDAAWSLMALSAGQQISLFGEWNGKRVRPLGISNGTKYTRCISVAAK